jgi:hypothetical protein
MILVEATEVRGRAISSAMNAKRDRSFLAAGTAADQPY